MKNKKLFAILTLVCFLFTLMPVAAFAASDPAKDTVIDGDKLAISADSGKLKVTVPITPAATTSGTAVIFAHQSPAREVARAAVNVGDTTVNAFVNPNDLQIGDMIGAVVTTADEVDSATKTTVGNQTNGKVYDNVLAAAVAGSADRGSSSVYTVKDNPSVSLDNNNEATAEVTYTLKNAGNVPTSAQVAIWFTESGSNIATSAVKHVQNATKTVLGNGSNVGNPTVHNKMENVWVLPAASEATVEVTFQRSGEYTLHAALLSDLTDAAVAGKTQNEQFNAIAQIKTASTNNKVTVKGASTASSKFNLKDANGKLANETVVNGETFAQTLFVEANNVANETLKFTLLASNAANADVVKGQNVKIETSSDSVSVSKTSATTNALGQFSFDISGAREGDYKIYITSGSFTATINVTVGATSPAYINVVKQPTNPIDIGKDNLNNIVRFAITDINGNSLAASSQAVRDLKASHSADGTDYNGDDVSNYVSIVSQPSASDLDNEDVYLAIDTTRNDGTKSSPVYPYATLGFKKELNAEGTYEFKVALDNGNYVTVTLEVKEFQTPVSINLTYAAPSVELGGSLVIDKLEWVDANGVTRNCTSSVSLAATGYAIKNFGSSYATDGSWGRITAKSDEKYLGSKITVTAVDERYNLIQSVDVTVVDEAAALKFGSKTGEVNVNNAIDVMIVDGEGNRVAIGAGATDVSVSYVILDKPADAKVTATTSSQKNNLKASGSFVMNLTSNKIGNVTVQAIVKVTNRQDETEGDSNQYVTKYYTGTQIFAIGTGSVGDVVVMSIGSSQIIVNDAVKTMDAQPVVQNNRTFVPFRALAEAFGATVAYDEATQAITAELNGVTVVMTVGSPTYTINGENKTMDVAPYISGSRTMVPIRFVAEAFGIKVIPTYDENGATADVLFNL